MNTTTTPLQRAYDAAQAWRDGERGAQHQLRHALDEIAETPVELTLTLAQYLAIERLRGSSSTFLRETASVKVELHPSYVRIAFVAGWGGKASYDIDLEGNSAAVNQGESEISIDLDEDES